MQRLYESVMALLEADRDGNDEGSLASLLLATATDSRIYKTSVQAHVQAQATGVRWITVGMVADIPDRNEQTEDVRIVDFNVEAWAREDTSEFAEALMERVKYLLDGADLGGPLLLAWYCRWRGATLMPFEGELQVWHGQVRFQAMVAPTA